MKQKNLIIGIDASRCRSGGAISHIVEILNQVNIEDHDISTIHLWAYKDLQKKIKEKEWLIKHHVPATEKGLLFQLAWQYFKLPKIIKKYSVDVIWNIDAASLCPAYPAVTLSQDMLSFEPGEMQRYSFTTFQRWRLEVLKILQIWRLKKSDMVIFLHQHAKKVISQYLPTNKNVTIIPHGISKKFQMPSVKRKKLSIKNNIKILYVSNFDLYKHQWCVIEAVSLARNEIKKDIKLILVGNECGLASKKVYATKNKFDPNSNFITIKGEVKNDDIPNLYKKSDLFLFASSCENFPIALLEAMGSGIPIISSDRGPMKDILGEKVLYFNPECPNSIKRAIINIILLDQIRLDSVIETHNRAKSYNWSNTAKDSFSSLSIVANNKAKILR